MGRYIVRRFLAWFPTALSSSVRCLVYDPGNILRILGMVSVVSYLPKNGSRGKMTHRLFPNPHNKLEVTSLSYLYDFTFINLFCEKGPWCLMNQSKMMMSHDRRKVSKLARAAGCMPDSAKSDWLHTKAPNCWHWTCSHSIRGLGRGLVYTNFVIQDGSINEDSLQIFIFRGKENATRYSSEYIGNSPKYRQWYAILYLPSPPTAPCTEDDSESIVLLPCLAVLGRVGLDGRGSSSFWSPIFPASFFAWSPPPDIVTGDEFRMVYQFDGGLPISTPSDQDERLPINCKLLWDFFEIIRAKLLQGLLK